MTRLTRGEITAIVVGVVAFFVVPHALTALAFAIGIEAGTP